MRKFSLSTQLLFLMLSVLLLTSILFGVLIYNKLDSMADSQALKNLSTVVSTSRESWSDSSITTDFKLQSDSDMVIGYVRLIPNGEMPNNFSQIDSYYFRGSSDNTGGSSDIETNPNSRSMLDRFDTYTSSNYADIVGSDGDNSIERFFRSVSYSDASKRFESIKRNFLKVYKPANQYLLVVYKLLVKQPVHHLELIIL